MEREYWHRQKPNKPLFPELIWSRPENKSAAGKLLIIGGHSQALAAPAQAYQAAQAAGAGNLRVLLPEAVRKSVQGVIDHVEFGSSTPSGSFAQNALGEWLEQAKWADGVLLAGDLGHNSETTILVEGFLSKYQGRLTLVGDTLDLVLKTPDLVLGRPNTLLVLAFNQLQKLSAGRVIKALVSSMDLLPFIESLYELQQSSTASYLVVHEGSILVAASGQVSTTPSNMVSLIELASKASVWWLQNPPKPFEAVTTSVI